MTQFYCPAVLKERYILNKKKEKIQNNLGDITHD